MTSLFSGRLARSIPNRLIEELGPVHPDTPAYPHATTALAPLRRAAEAQGLDDFTPLWAGQGAPLARVEPAKELAERLLRDALEVQSL
jgi:nitronate monooxygenase